MPKEITYWLLVYVENFQRTKKHQRQLQREAKVRTSRLELFWLLAVSINDDMNMNNLDSDSESDSKVETNNIMSSKKLNNIIKHLKREIKSNKHSEAINYVQNSAIPTSRQGKHSKTWSFLWTIIFDAN
ncbi:2357_t:CDS:2 [Cetraspora pellucida]|uniref:2357_t:CDS:1 n=1 Tax=Cetraspora pellucida TaxID=1433469 RepID=A0A9N9PBF5_9GLOM|nr:2357_t:CDS:2 [Cetraspora pellucida]